MGSWKKLWGVHISDKFINNMDTHINKMFILTDGNPFKFKGYEQEENVLISITVSNHTADNVRITDKSILFFFVDNFDKMRDNYINTLKNIKIIYQLLDDEQKKAFSKLIDAPVDPLATNELKG